MGKRYVSQEISRPRFLKGFEISRTCLPPVSHREKARAISKPYKNWGLESYSNIFFPLDFKSQGIYLVNPYPAAHQYRYQNFTRIDVLDGAWGKTISERLFINQTFPRFSQTFFRMERSAEISIRFFKNLCSSKSHLLKRDDLAAHLEVNKCLKISPLFQAIFALSFRHYI